MAIERDDPYGVFNYKVLIEAGPVTVRGAFSDVSGLSTELQYAEYRDGTDPRNRPRKIPTTFKVGDITLKRGVIGATDLFEWVEKVRAGEPDTRATVLIELKDENNDVTVCTWKLEGARPMKWTGPTLAAKGGTDVAMEELVLCAEDLHFQ